MDSEKVVLRTHSHRASSRLDSELGYHPPRYYDTALKYGGVFVLLSKEDAARVLEIKGVKRTRLKLADIGRCWH